MAQSSSKGPKKAAHEATRQNVQLREGQVVIGHGRSVVVEDQRGNLTECTVRNKLGRVVCGDLVQWQATSRGQGVVEFIHPRKTLVERHGNSGRSKPMAANVDQIIITSAPQPPLSENLIDHYLVAAELIGTASVIVINKSDLLDDEQQSEIHDRLKEYMQIGYPVLFCNARAAHGTDLLFEVLQNRTSIFVGQSGVGKSSLLHTLLPDQDIRVGHLSSATGLGRHTTSSTTLYHLSRDSHLIDSPGVRDFQLWHVEPNKIATGFLEFQSYLGHCRFHNCRHMQEPGCAVQDAANNHQISERRLESYRKIVNKLEEHK